jgi:tetratricopeptide (TPR) repeat protein
VPESFAIANDRLTKLALDTGRLSTRRLWNALSIATREAAATALLRSDDDTHPREKAIEIIAAARHFRPQTVADWSIEKIAATMARIEVGDTNWMSNALVAHAESHDELGRDFLSQVGGPINEKQNPSEIIADALIGEAADRIAQKYVLEDVVVWLLTIRLMNPGVFGHIANWFKRRLRASEEIDPLPTLPTQPEQPEPATTTLDAVGFTTLDRRLTQIIVDAVAGVIGAPARDEVDDILLEVEKLNGRRHQTFFQVGFRDALFGREPASKLAGDNADRRRWYVSGFVAGIARTGDWKAIAALYDEQASVREIADQADGASGTSAWIVFRALCETSRFPEAAALVRTDVIKLSPELRQSVLATATRLIRASRAADARPLLDRLWSAHPTDDDYVDDDDAGFWLGVKRRRALTLRQLGDPQAATTLLWELAQNADPVTRAIAFTDLGLIEAGIRRLGDLRLPATKNDLPTFVDNLARGEGFFRHAIESPTFQPAHAQFALGVLALMRERYQEATQPLDSALSFFGRSPDVYRTDGSLALAELYLGVALCHSLEDTGRLERACELIRSALAANAKLPRWLVRSTIDAMWLGGSDLMIATAGDLLASDDGALDELIESAAGRSTPAITKALFVRAASPTRSAPRRAADYRTVVPLLLQDGSIQRATDALEYLEEQAAVGMAAQEFVEFLESAENFSPAWDAERATESRSHLLESEGRFEEAAGLLEKLFYRLLAQDEEHAIDRAELLVGHLDAYGAEYEPLVQRLVSRLEGKRKVTDGPDDGSDGVPSGVHLRILVVGGNEVQARMDKGIVDRIHSEFPNIEIEFLHSGWKGNWASHASDFDRRVRRADGVIFLALMRTMFGRTVRHGCSVPWRGSRGKGQGQIVEAIKRVLPFALRWKNRIEVAV